jgi:ATP-binding cassette subfamily B protein
MADGFESEIAQGGTNVSGGQKQRLSIARALVRKPEIYIFDDSFSALDFKTDAKLRAALRRETRDATVLIVSQRVSTVMDADQILVLDEGRLVGVGTHRELMRTCEVYREIVSSQLSSEEIAEEIA